MLECRLQKILLFGLDFLLLLFELQLQLGCFYAFSVSRLRAFLFPVARVFLVFGVVLRDLLNVGYLGQSALTIGLTCLAAYFSGSILFIELFLFKDIFSCPWNFILGVDFDKLFFQTKTGERVKQIISEFLINIFLDFLLEDLKLSLSFELHNVLNVPF